MKTSTLAKIWAWVFFIGIGLLSKEAKASGLPRSLRFSNHRFKILQFTDLHWIMGEKFRKGNDSAMSLMRYLISTEKPDLVVFTGDIVVSGGAATAWKQVTAPLAELGVPFAVAFGNHDTETDLTKKQALAVIRSNPYNITYNADSSISGVGNCTLTIKDATGEKDKWVLYLFDSHAYASDSLIKGYDWIHNDQIQWYRRESARFTAANGGPLPSLAFFHIPLPEFGTVGRQSSTVGTRGEEVCAPPVNSGLFASFLEMGDVCGVFAGHDHNNDFAGVIDNICLAYGRKTGYNAPYPEILEKGARVIELHDTNSRIDTYIRTLSGTCHAFSWATRSAASSSSSRWPIADGTFIQSDLVARWDDRRWQQELRALKDVGMHYIILAPTLHTGKDNVSTTLYPSGLPGVRREYAADIVENCLRNAEKAGFKVFLGLNLHERWWDADFSAEWLYDQMELGNRVADELVKKYKNLYKSAFYGWYWVWEVDNLHTKSAAVQDALAIALNKNIDHLHSLTPSMPFLLCPFMNFRVGTARENQEMWTYVFARTHFQPGDIFSPQDGIGAGGLELDKLQEWYGLLKKAVDTKPGLLFWSDAETFDQRTWTIAPLDRFIRQMDLASPYVSNIISFAYSHYYSPFKVNSGYHDAYLHYVREGALPAMPAPDPVMDVKVAPDEHGILTLSWSPPARTKGIAGYYIFRNGELTANNQYNKEGLCKTSYTEKKALPTGVCHYEVCSYTFSGVVSEKKKLDWENLPAAAGSGRDGFIHNKVIAHRGAWKDRGVSENSVSSLRNAISLGCEGSEFDVWMSSDSGLIISHDPVIGGKTIETSTAGELKKIPLLNGDFVPTLEQYLNIIKTQHRTKLFLEIKSSLISQERSLALTERVVRTVREAGAREWVSYISFNYGILSRVKELDPGAETAYLSGDKKVEALQSGHMTGLDYPFYSFHSDTVLTRDAHRAGLNVNVWTVDNKEEMKFLLQQGVDRITTNEPQLLLDIVQKPE